MNDEQHEQMVGRLADHLQDFHRARAKIIATHISRIILCGDYAFKLKRPVKLPFVDFSTLEKRHFFCLEELRVNQQTAPDLYLSVQTITGTLEQPRIDGHGPLLDYVVVMNRFEDGALLSERLASGRLDQRDIDGLAQSLATTHTSALVASEKTLIDCTPTINWLNECLREIADSEFGPQAIDFEMVQQWVVAEHKKVKALDQIRRANGFYRECHGDLHLANIVRVKDRIMAFDALEFESSLRLIDIINDVAFPFMDLLAHHQGSLAWRLINSWCEKTGDYAGLATLNFYTLYRALVRAKVAALSADETKFERYWRLTRALCQPEKSVIFAGSKPKVIVVCGLSGSGKSTVAQRMLEQLGAIRLRADVERKRLFATALNQPAALYSDEANQKTYDRLFELADYLHSIGLHVIVDATFVDQARVDQFTAYFSHLAGQTCQIVLCQAPIEAMRSRIITRQSHAQDPSDATPAILDQQVARQSKKAMQWLFTLHRLDNDGSIADLELKTDRLVTSILTTN